MSDPPDVTRLLRQITSGDAEASEDLLPLVHAELRRPGSTAGDLEGQCSKWIPHVK